MSRFLLSFSALAFLVVVAGCKQNSDAGSMDSMNMKGDKAMAPATMPAEMK
jgi:hypothetical protein